MEKGTAVSSSGIVFNGKSTVDAKDYRFERTSASSTGIQFTGTSTTLNASNSSNVIGKSTSAGVGAGILFSNTTVNINAPDTLQNNFEGTSVSSSGIQFAGTSTTLKGSNSINVIGKSTSGLGIGFSGTSIVDAKDYVLEGTSASSTGIQFTGTSTTLKASNSSNVIGKSTSAGAGAGILISNTTININAPDTIINNFVGTSASRSGIQIGTSGTTTNINASSTKLNMVGTSTASNGGGISYFGTSTISSKTLDTVGKNLNYVGIFFQGNANATIRTSAAQSVMVGSGSAGGLGVWADMGTVVTLDSGANSTSTITLKTGTDSLSGIRIGWAGNSTFNTIGDITIGSNDSSYTNNASVMMQGTVNARGKFTMKGRSAGDGIFFQDGGGFGAQIIGSQDAIITLDGTSTGGGNGINLSLNSNGWRRAHLISTTGVSGQINLNGVSARATGVFTGQAQIIGNDGSKVFIEGQGSRGVYIGATNPYLASLAQANIPSINAGSVKVLGTALNTGVQIDGTVNTSAAVFLTGDAINISGTGGTGAGVILSGKLNNDSKGGATTIQSTNSNINFGSAAAVTNISNAGAININAIGGENSTSAITSTNGATITQNANADVLLSTDGKGNLTPAKIIKNSTGGGNVTIAAGKLLQAGDGTGGQILTNSSTTITNFGTGKVYLYSGKASSTGLLSNFGNALGLNTLVVDGTNTQNADTNVAYNANSLGISGSIALAQVMLREKVSVTNNLVGTTVTKTYGDADTAGTVSAALLAETKTNLKQETANTGFYNTTTNGTGANNIKIAKSVVIDSLSGALAVTTSDFSTSGYLKANVTGYTYGALTSSKYNNAGIASNNSVKVAVDKLALTGVTIDRAVKIYGDALSAGAVNFTGSNLKSGDVVGGIASVQSTTNDFSSSNHLKVGSYDQKVTTLTNGNANNDATNYTFSPLINQNSYEVKKLSVSVVAQQANLNYTGALLSQNLMASRPFITGDKVVVSGLAKGTAVGSYLSALSANGEDVGNYDIDLKDGTLVIAYSGANKAPTPPETYTRIASDVVNLAPVSFAVGVAPATAAGDEADPNICYAWGQRNGGSVTVHTLLKPSYLGLRHAKTDTQEAMSNSGGSSSHSASPCDHEVSTFFANADNI